MNAEQFDVEVALLHEHAQEIAKAKRPGYTQASPDVLANFKSAAADAGVTPLQAWSILANKHFSAIKTFAKDPNIPQAEAIIGRFCDALNYLALGWGLVREYEAQQREGR